MSFVTQKLAWAVLAATVTAAVQAEAPSAAPDLAATQIVEKNLAARGGQDAWCRIQTMVWVGHMESANTPMASMPFELQQKRPNKSRFEITALGHTSARMFDGVEGWKLQGAAGGRPTLVPYNAQELKFAQDGEGIDAPLIDCQLKASAVTLEGIEEADGRKAYRLRVRRLSGTVHHVWVDAETFLEIKYDRISYTTGGVPVVVSVFYRNYKMIEGLQIPTTIEIGADSGKAPDRMVIEKISLNPPLEDRAFSRPGATHERHTGTRAGEQAQPAAMPAAEPASG
jgi:hypothetical protein